MKQKISLFAFILVVGLSLTNRAEAFFTTAQSAAKLTDTTVAYTVTYKFGNFSYDTYLPVSTLRNLMNAESNHSLGYSLRNTDNEIEQSGVATGLVFAKLPIKDGMYFLEAGKVASFNLVTFFKVDNRTPQSDYRLLVENLPFPTVVGENVQKRRLNPSELKYYTTPAVKIGY